MREEEEEERAPDGGMPLDFLPSTLINGLLKKGKGAKRHTQEREGNSRRIDVIEACMDCVLETLGVGFS